LSSCSFYLAGFFNFNIQSGTSPPEDLTTFAILEREIFMIKITALIALSVPARGPSLIEPVLLQKET
jgi:hypothetical protein